MNSNKQLITISSTALFLVLFSSVGIGAADAQAQYQPPPAQQQGQRPQGADISVQQPSPHISVQQPAPRVQVQQPQPQISVQQPAPNVEVQQPQPHITVQQPQPQVTVQQPPPKITVQQPPPQVTVQQPKPEVTVQQAKPEVQVQQQGQPEVIMQQQGQPQVQVRQQGQPQVTVQEQGQPQVQIQQQPGQLPQIHQQGQHQSAQSMAVVPTGWRSTQLTGREIRDAQGEDLGDIHDFIIRRDGTVSQVILNLKDRKVTVPFNSLQVTGPDTVLYQGTRQQLAQLPTYQEERQAVSEENVPPLVGRDVRNAQNEQLGDIDDLIINPDGRVSVVVSMGGLLGVGNRLVVVPFHSIQLTGQDYVLYEGTRDQLAQLPEFDYNQLQRGVSDVTTPESEREGQRGVVE